MIRSTTERTKKMSDCKINWLLSNVSGSMHVLKLKGKTLKYLRMATFNESEISVAG
jgi:hypothetical protein